ncbi:hypothetical protein DGo_PA0115 (plasmid) [Deinococcus gobiensis I-0]|uniref:Uncharacterized protein n=1 Tax=Deinococcus gobiensis (strain DSM 21396 / JCM 16679 / CGMCC 1.7299 / I-0) TaxID=745776 RepID=H8H0Y2_DEIGI|nr:hypothetical protein DGo_PA0115 [Deinococcus gobiensis I-0]
MFTDTPLEGLEHPRSSPPGHVKARHTVAGEPCTRAATLGPADRRKPAHALGMEPLPLLTGGELHIGLRPRSGPPVLRAVESRSGHPVPQCQLRRIVDAQAALFGAVYEKQPPERPEGLSPQILLAFLVEKQDPPPGIGQLGGGDQPGQPGPHDNHICIGCEHDLLDRLTALRTTRHGIEGPCAEGPFDYELVFDQNSGGEGPLSGPGPRSPPERTSPHPLT